MVFGRSELRASNVPGGGHSALKFRGRPWISPSLGSALVGSDLREAADAVQPRKLARAHPPVGRALLQR